MLVQAEQGQPIEQNELGLFKIPRHENSSDRRLAQTSGIPSGERQQIASVRSMTTVKASTKRAKAAKTAEEPIPRKNRHQLSPEASQRIADAQKKRWAAESSASSGGECGL